MPLAAAVENLKVNYYDKMEADGTDRLFAADRSGYKRGRQIASASPRAPFLPQHAAGSDAL